MEIVEVLTSLIKSPFMLYYHISDIQTCWCPKLYDDVE